MANSLWPKRCLVVALAFSVMSMLPACGPEAKPQSAEERGLQALAVFYGRYLSQHKGKGPNDEADFKNFISTKLTPADLDTFGVNPANLDPLFISPRDKERYGIAWHGKTAAPKAEGNSSMVIWEQKGVNGKRFVVDQLGKIEEVSDEVFKQRQSGTKSSTK